VITIPPVINSHFALFTLMSSFVGFDPIFYFHHCNVDRILSFWEHVYPDYVAGTDGFLDNDATRKPFSKMFRCGGEVKLTLVNHIAQPDGTYIDTAIQEVNGETPLMPFRKSDYSYWNSKDTHSLLMKDEVANNKCAITTVFIESSLMFMCQIIPISQSGTSISIRRSLLTSRRERRSAHTSGNTLEPLKKRVHTNTSSSSAFPRAISTGHTCSTCWSR
jgi:hypothetical protein